VDSPPGRLRDHLKPILVVALAAIGVAVFYLAIYKVRHFPMPIGWDTPRYLSQTNFVAERGLAGVPHALPPPSKTLTSRAGFPVLVLTLSSLFHVSTFKVAAIVPAAGAVAVALAAGALVTSTLRRGVWEGAAVAVMVGVSPVLVRLFAPESYADNLLAAALFLAAMIPLVSTVRDGVGFVPTILLLAAGGLAHGSFFAITLAILGGVFLLYAPGSWRAWRDGRLPLLQTPSGRLGLVAGTSALLAGAAIYGLLRTSPDTPKLSRGELSKKLREDIPLYLFPVTVPLAALGAWFVARDASQVDRSGSPAGEDGAAVRPTDRFASGFLLRLMLAWVAVVLAGVIAYSVGANVPAHRFLAFLLPLPVLAALSLLGLRRLVASRGARAAALALVLAGMAGLTALGTWDLYVNLPEDRGVEWLELNKVQDTKTAAAYLDETGVPRDAPFVIVVDDTGSNPLSYVPEMGYIIRSALPADRGQHLHLYVGNPENYLAGRPTYRSRPKTYDTNSNRFWKPLEPLLAERPVALILRSFNPLYERAEADHPDWVVGPSVIALNGPRPATPVAPPPIPTGPRTLLQGGGLGAGTLALLALLGLGWAVALLPGGLRSFEAVALSPAFGIGFLLVGGILVDAVGIRLTGGGGIGTVVLVAVAGWTMAGLKLRGGLDRALARFPSA
jgi:hypothetical protein